MRVIHESNTRAAQRSLPGQFTPLCSLLHDAAATAIDRALASLQDTSMVGKSRGARALLMGLSIVLTRLAVAQDAGVSLPDAAIPDASSAEGDVPDTPTCVDDAFEPNQSVAQATPLTPGVHVDAVVCAGDPDLYRFTPPVPAGSLFLVTVDFTHALGDIDARLISLGSGATVALSESVNDDEQLVARADGGDYALLVTLFSGTGNAYGVDVSAVVNDATNECCSTSPGPGCNDLAVSECVCLTDVRCCSGSYDEVCVLQAAAECGAACALPPPTSDCCSAASDPGNSPGCAVPAVEACVCAIDPFCCGGRFDQSCANLARVTCGASCPEGR